MKNIIYTIVFSIATLFSYSASAQSYYPLICRGSPTIDARVNWCVQGKEGIAPIPVNICPVSAQVYYHASSLAAGATGSTLQPGECSWVDRPLHSNEPLNFYDNNVGMVSFAMKNNSITVSHRYVDWFSDAHYFQVMVTNAGTFMKLQPGTSFTELR